MKIHRIAKQSLPTAPQGLDRVQAGVNRAGTSTLVTPDVSMPLVAKPTAKSSLWSRIGGFLSKAISSWLGTLLQSLLGPVMSFFISMTRLFRPRGDTSSKAKEGAPPEPAKQQHVWKTDTWSDLSRTTVKRR